MKNFTLLLITLFSFATNLAAREVITLNSNWRFYFSSENSADYARPISLPHTWAYDNSKFLVSSQSTTANYLRELYIPATWRGKRLFVKFYGVESVADLLINGQYVGEHRGGATAFTFEITSRVVYGQTNRLHMVVNDAPQSDVLPTSTEKNRYGGIYRDVELIVTEPSVISPLHYGSDGVFVVQQKVSQESAEGVVQVYVDAPQSGGQQIALSIFDNSDKVIYQKILTKVKSGTEPNLIAYNILSPKLWSPSEPNLYRFEVKLVDEKGTDMVAVHSGFRSVEVANNGLMLINDEPIQFRGVALYHDYPHVGGAAAQCDIDADMAIVNELGANAIRSAVHPHHPYLYDLCDREGKLVWIDFPFSRAPFLGDIAYYPTEQFHAQGRETMREIVAQNFNHPSVVMWGIFSLLSTRGDNPIEYIKELNKLVKELDTSRLTVAQSDQDGEINSITDLIVWNQSLGWNRGLFSDIDVWSDILHSKWSSLRSGVSYGQGGRVDQQSTPKEYKGSNQYSAEAWLPEGRARIFHEEYASRIATDSLFWGLCLNSMFDYKSTRNTLGENNSGLVSFDRRSRKDIFYLYKAHWNKQQKTLHIADSRCGVANDTLYSVTVYASDTLPPIVYSSLDTVTMKRIAPWYFVADSITLSPGVNKIVVEQASQRDSVHVVFQNTESPQNIPSRRLSQ